MMVASSCGEVIDISRLPRAIASSSVPCLNRVAFQCGSNVAKSATAGPNTLVSATARWSVSVAGEDRRSSTLSAAAARPAPSPMPAVTSEAADAPRNVRRSRFDRDPDELPWLIVDDPPCPRRCCGPVAVTRLDARGRCRARSPPGTDASCGLYLVSFQWHNVRNGTFKSIATACCPARTEIELRASSCPLLETPPGNRQARTRSGRNAARHPRDRARGVCAEWPVGREDRRDRGAHPRQQADDLLLFRRQGRPLPSRAGERLPHRTRGRGGPRCRAPATHRSPAPA